MKDWGNPLRKRKKRRECPADQQESDKLVHVRHEKKSWAECLLHETIKGRDRNAITPAAKGEKEKVVPGTRTSAEDSLGGGPGQRGGKLRGRPRSTRYAR